VNDESQLQVSPKDSESSLSISKAQSGLIARGLRDAAMLTAPVGAESEEQRAGVFVGVLSDYLERGLRPTEEVRTEAERGDAKQQNILACTYAYAYGSGKDLAEAAKCYRQAADQGLSTAQFNLGRAYYNGLGLVQDHVQAYMWISLASPHANVNDGKRYAAICDRVAAKMNPTQIAEAQRLARQWKPFDAKQGYPHNDCLQRRHIELERRMAGDSNAKTAAFTASSTWVTWKGLRSEEPFSGKDNLARPSLEQSHCRRYSRSPRGS
jgi:hypothetical protein